MAVTRNRLEVAKRRRRLMKLVGVDLVFRSGAVVRADTSFFRVPTNRGTQIPSGLKMHVPAWAERELFWFNPDEIVAIVGVYERYDQDKEAAQIALFESAVAPPGSEDDDGDEVGDDDV